MSQKTTLNSGSHNPMMFVFLPWKKFEPIIIAGGVMFNQDYKEFFQLLNDNQVHYLVVGGYAVALHGYPRYTKDIDIWIELSKENALQIIKTLGQFGFASLGLKENDFLVEDQIIQLGYAPNRIDIITTLPGVTFNECYEKRLSVEIDGVKVNLIDLDSLRKNKKASGRFQDLADLEKLE
jgi:predicted nucleotidyltransferase